MLKEIYEQPRAPPRDTLRGRVSPESGSVVLPDINLDRDNHPVCPESSSSPAARPTMPPSWARFLIERLTGLPAEVDVASECAVPRRAGGPRPLVVALSQSGETADTLGAVKAARLRGAPIVGITNVVGSALAREATGIVYTPAGPEIGVALVQDLHRHHHGVLSPRAVAGAPSRHH